MTADVLDRARESLDTDAQTMARDALHAAVVMQGGFEAACSYDQDFDRVEGLVRGEPGWPPRVGSPPHGPLPTP